jgi:hypothetical protein
MSTVNDKVFGPPLPAGLNAALINAARIARKPHLVLPFPMIIFQREDTGDYGHIAENHWPDMQIAFFKQHGTKVRRVVRLDAEVGEWQPRRTK